MHQRPTHVDQQQGPYVLLKGKLAGMVQQKYAIAYTQLLARLPPTIKRPGDSLGDHEISFLRNEEGMLNDRYSLHLHLFKIPLWN